MLNREVVKADILVFVSGLKRKVFNFFFLPLNVVLAVDMSYMVFRMYIPSIDNLMGIFS